MEETLSNPQNSQSIPEGISGNIGRKFTTIDNYGELINQLSTNIDTRPVIAGLLRPSNLSEGKFRSLSEANPSGYILGDENHYEDIIDIAHAFSLKKEAYRDSGYHIAGFVSAIDMILTRMKKQELNTSTQEAKASVLIDQVLKGIDLENACFPLKYNLKNLSRDLPQNPLNNLSPALLQEQQFQGLGEEKAYDYIQLLLTGEGLNVTGADNAVKKFDIKKIKDDEIYRALAIEKVGKPPQVELDTMDIMNECLKHRNIVFRDSGPHFARLNQEFFKSFKNYFNKDSMEKEIVVNDLGSRFKRYYEEVCQLKTVIPNLEIDKKTLAIIGQMAITVNMYDETNLNNPKLPFSIIDQITKERTSDDEEIEKHEQLVQNITELLSKYKTKKDLGSIDDHKSDAYRVKNTYVNLIEGIRKGWSKDPSTYKNLSKLPNTLQDIFLSFRSETNTIEFANPINRELFCMALLTECIDQNLLSCENGLYLPRLALEFKKVDNDFTNFVPRPNEKDFGEVENIFSSFFTKLDTEIHKYQILHPDYKPDIVTSDTVFSIAKNRKMLKINETNFQIEDCRLKGKVFNADYYNNKDNYFATYLGQGPLSAQIRDKLYSDNYNIGAHAKDFDILKSKQPIDDAWDIIKYFEIILNSKGLYEKKETNKTFDIFTYFLKQFNTFVSDKRLDFKDPYQFDLQMRYFSDSEHVNTIANDIVLYNNYYNEKFPAKTASQEIIPSSFKDAVSDLCKTRPNIKTTIESMDPNFFVSK
jgi:hypothetical protein